jgi:predicted RNase H-like HicB family nuclease
MDRYIFPAIFEVCEEGGYTVTFPDLPGCITEGDDIAEALRMAKDALELHLYCFEEDREEIPDPTAPELLKLDEGCFTVLVEVYMKLVRDEMLNKAVKKTLTIPRWLDNLALEKKVNFSAILQLALKETLGIKDKK